MAQFNFEARLANGKRVRGKVESSSAEEARVRLRAQGLDPIRVGQKTANSFKLSTLLGGSPVPAKEMQIFTRQFATLINSGVHIVQSLELLANGAKNLALRKCLSDVVEQVSKGKGLAAALALYPLIFDRLYVNMVRAGEEGGVLDVVLTRLAQYIEKSVKLRSKVTGALWYPAIIMVVAAVVITAILIFVIPQFQDLFTQSGQNLPALTQMVINLSDLFIQRWYLALLVMVGGPTFAIYWARSPGGKPQFDRLILKVPILGKLVQMSAIARLTRTLGTLIQSGVPLIEALEICSHVVGNYEVEKVVQASRESITKGQTMTEPLGKSPIIPHMVVQMLSVGEQTGAMDEMLSKIADFYEEEVDSVVGALTSIIEPIMMVFLGGIIAVLVIAMYLPIFNLAGAAGV